MCIYICSQAECLLQLGFIQSSLKEQSHLRQTQQCDATCEESGLLSGGNPRVINTLYQGWIDLHHRIIKICLYV